MAIAAAQTQFGCFMRITAEELTGSIVPGMYRAVRDGSVRSLWEGLEFEVTRGPYLDANGNWVVLAVVPDIYRVDGDPREVELGVFELGCTVRGICISGSAWNVARSTYYECISTTSGRRLHLVA